MLIVFAPQVVFYGVAVVLAGTLQAGERFSWPALAPLMSSVVVIAAYLIFAGMSSGAGTAAGLHRSAELVLSVGTTAGVLVLAVSQIPATLRLRLRLRPTLRFPTGIAPFARRAAIAGAVTLASQQLATVVMVRLANGGASGTLVVLTIAQTVYLVPWAVLAVPVATAMFPRMSAAWDAGATERAADIATSGLRIAGCLAAVGVAVLVSAATPIANVLLDTRKDAHSVFGPAIAAFAVGLLGWSAVAVLSRALYAARRPRLAAAGQAFGWLVTVLFDIAVSHEVDRHHRAVALALGNACGVTIAAVILLSAAMRLGAIGHRYQLIRTGSAAVLAAAAGSGAGWALSHSIVTTQVLGSIGVGLAAAAIGGAVSVAVIAVVDRDVVALIRQGVRSG
jgi:putative peptidoglycan lipid II flippase